MNSTKKIKTSPVSDGFSLVEVMIFVTLFNFIFVAIATYITNFLRATQLQEHRLIATHYADDLMEWLKGEKDRDWNNLVDKSGRRNGPGNESIYCFNEQIPLTPNVFPSWKEGECRDYSTIGSTAIQRIYKRILILEKVNPPEGQPVSQIRVRVRVDWQEGDTVLSAPLSTVFSVWKDQ